MIDRVYYTMKSENNKNNKKVKKNHKDNEKISIYDAILRGMTYKQWVKKMKTVYFSERYWDSVFSSMVVEGIITDDHIEEVKKNNKKSRKSE
jgi:hypothetical protein